MSVLSQTQQDLLFQSGIVTLQGDSRMYEKDK